MVRMRMLKWKTAMRMMDRNLTMSECILMVSTSLMSPLRYSDDEDTSYKIRRSATKVLAAVIGTRPELLGNLYKSVSPVLISRFGDREESVRLEVWGTYVLLLTQTGVYGDQVKESDGSTVGGKRKREEEGQMEVEETPYTLLRSQVPSLSKALLKQLQSSKTQPTTLQAGFNLLLVLLTVLPGCLHNQVTAIITTTQSVLSQPSTTATSALHVTVLSFLARFFATHSATAFNASLSAVIPPLLNAVREKHPRVAVEAFCGFSALLMALKPVNVDDWTDSLYDEAVHRLKANDTDAEVRERAGELIADLWVSAPDVVKRKGGQEWQALLRSGGRTEGAVRVVRRVATEAEVDDQWINTCIDWVSNVLKKSGRAGKLDAFVTLNTLISKCVLPAWQQLFDVDIVGRYRAGVPADLAPHLIPQLEPYLTTADIALLSQALTTLTILLQCSPTSSFPEVEREVLHDIYPLAHSPLVSGACLDALLGFFGALVEADSQIASHVVPGLVSSLSKAKKAEAVPGNVAKVVSRVVRSQKAVAAGMIVEFSRSLKVCHGGYFQRVIY
jgi:cullin-associated NEDD8-dissociated protein 1